MKHKFRIPDEFGFTRGQVVAALLLFVICFFYRVAGTETLTLTTYYPAPYGAYVAILTTRQTLLARDGGNVGIGVKRPEAKLHVESTTSGFIPPRFDDNAARDNNITYPGEGSMIYNRQNKRIEFWDGANWKPAFAEATECPAGFTAIEAAGRRLGCMETSQHGRDTYANAVVECFNNYGGRLPMYSEWHIAMNLFTMLTPLTVYCRGSACSHDEPLYWEWLGNSDNDYYYAGGSAMAIAGANWKEAASAISYWSGWRVPYRCWIPG